MCSLASCATAVFEGQNEKTDTSVRAWDGPQNGKTDRPFFVFSTWSFFNSGNRKRTERLYTGVEKLCNRRLDNQAFNIVRLRIQILKKNRFFSVPQLKTTKHQQKNVVSFAAFAVCFMPQRTGPLCRPFCSP